MTELLNGNRGQQRDWILCGHCHKVVAQMNHCPRCFAKINYRKPQSEQKAWALWLTALIMLFPANFYPITQLTNKGITGYDTIFSGIVSLVDSEMYGIAVIVFVASIMVPIMKLVGLALVLCCIRFQWPLSRRTLMWCYRIIEFIGRWSMLDLFVIGLVASLINMGQLLDAKPALAATFFALVIIFTQLAAKAIDTRLLWDLRQHHE